VKAVAQQRELVAAEAGNRVAAARYLGKAATGLDQDPSPAPWPNESLMVLKLSRSMNSKPSRP
jgi:hypothetical protein